MQLFDNKIIKTAWNPSHWGIRKCKGAGIQYYLCWCLTCLQHKSVFHRQQELRKQGLLFLDVFAWLKQTDFFLVILLFFLLEKEENWKLQTKTTPSASLLLASYCKTQLPKLRSKRSKLKPYIWTFYIPNNWPRWKIRTQATSNSFWEMQARGSMKNPTKLVLRHGALGTINTIANLLSVHRQEVIAKDNYSVVEETR